MNLFVLIVVIFITGTVLLYGRHIVRCWRIFRYGLERILLEDTLKHLYHNECKEIPSTLENLAGAIHVPRDRMVELVTRLEALEQIRARGAIIQLTPSGRSSALHMVRIHRLWERYLADETGMRETGWHADAETMEHLLSRDDANQLSNQMGHPVFDPHGAPIPTHSGDLPPKSGIPLTQLSPGKSARILWIEDEPESVYSQLVAQQLHPGMNLHMICSSPERIVFETEGEGIALAPIFAGNIFVKPLVTEHEPLESYIPLSSLRQGNTATVVAISRAFRGRQRRRLLDLGVVRGARIGVELETAHGDPVAYRIRGSLIALRKDQTKYIFVDTEARDDT